ncbi:MAG: hypothetical protein M1832_000826 [Thelocarpon impressellum]|nr:MAG: hypothetical protein M1832_000826 [Thelocarpon impressellum]
MTVPVVSRRALSLLAFVIILPSNFAQDTRSCFFPNGGVSDNDRPCGTDGSAHSACCAQDAYCLSNGLCSNGHILSRGSCTDLTWASPACTAFCRSTNPSGGIIIVSCNLSRFACDIGTCSRGNFTLPSANITRALRAPIPTPAGANATDANATCSSAPAVTVVQSDNKKPLAVGLGLGLPLGLALVAALTLLFLERRKDRVHGPGGGASAVADGIGGAPAVANGAASSNPAIATSQDATPKYKPNSAAAVELANEPLIYELGHQQSQHRR